jgi:hypothetical protein
MPWIDLTKSEENDEYQCHRFERLVKDDTGEEIGSIMQFYNNHPFYAISAEIGRLGPHDTIEEARHAVEQHSWKKAMALFIPPPGPTDA